LITLAGNEGRIQLVLRNGSDHGIEKTNGRQLAELYGRGATAKSKRRVETGGREGDPEPPARPARPRPVTVAAAAPAPVVPSAPPPPPPDEIVTFRGTVRAVETVNGGKKN
jgi:hypothetical protein